MERYASIKRATKETDITAVLSLDGAGNGKIASPKGSEEYSPRKIAPAFLIFVMVSKGLAVSISRCSELS